MSKSVVFYTVALYANLLLFLFNGYNIAVINCNTIFGIASSILNTLREKFLKPPTHLVYCTADSIDCATDNT